MVDLPEISSIAQSPDTEFDLQSQGKSFPTNPLTSAESNLLQSQLESIMTAQPSSVMNTLVQERQDAIALTASFAKQVFDEKLFNGVNAGDNEIGFDVLRPGQIRADPSNGNAVNDWYFTPNSTGWVDWIGNDGANNYTLGEDQVSVVLGFMDQSSAPSAISGINVDTFGRNVDMLPQDLNDMRLKDNENEIQMKSMPTLIAQENDDVHVRLRFDRTVERQPRLFGFTFGLGTFLNNENY